MENTTLKAKKLNSYGKIDRNGNPIDIFVYKLTGTKSALARYEEIQGDNYREDEETGDVLYFSTRYFGDTGEVIITVNDRIAPNMGQQREWKSIVAQNPGQIGEALANKIAEQLLGVKATTPPAETPAVVVADNSSDDEELEQEAEEQDVTEDEDADFNA